MAVRAQVPHTVIHATLSKGSPSEPKKRIDVYGKNPNVPNHRNSGSPEDTQRRRSRARSGAGDLTPRRENRLPTDATELLAEVRARAAELIPRGEEIRAERLGCLKTSSSGFTTQVVQADGRGLNLQADRRLCLNVARVRWSCSPFLDGSLGWLTHTSARREEFFVPSFSEETTQAAVFAAEASALAGTGFPAGRARPVPGGYKVSGRWLYASGAQYAGHCLQPTHAARKTAREWCGHSPFFPIK